MKTKIGFSFFLFLFLCVVIPESRLQAEERIALVIGNGAYETSPLSNPVNDATDVAGVLGDLDFNVSLIKNAEYGKMQEKIREFGRKIADSADSVGLFYFAGHGVQVQGMNYLVPINADIQSEEEVAYKAINSGFVLSKMETAGNKINIIILDACRDNPYKTSFRSASRGLSMVEAPTGSIVIYATAPGRVAMDGNGRNGVFSEALLKHIRKPNINIESMLKRVRQDVIKATEGKQIPWSSSSLFEDFYFVRKENRAIGEENKQKIVTDRRDREKDAEIPQPDETGSIIYGLPNRVRATLHSEGFKQQIEGIGRIQEVPAGEYIITIPWSKTYIERKEISITSGSVTELFRIGKDMVRVKKNVSSSDITNAYLISKYEMTNQQVAEILNWALMKEKVKLQGDHIICCCPNEHILFNLGSGDALIEYKHGQFFAVENRKDFPCVTISWYGAVACCNYLSMMEGYEPVYDLNDWGCDWSTAGYRLPTGSEWEYAACGGNSEVDYSFSGSDDLGSVGWHSNNSGFRVHKVGGKKPNQLGIYDMSGNAREWCWDCEVIDENGSCKKRMIRGGGIYNTKKECDITNKSSLPPSQGRGDLGFRIILPFE